MATGLYAYFDPLHISSLAERDVMRLVTAFEELFLAKSTFCLRVAILAVTRASSRRPGVTPPGVTPPCVVVRGGVPCKRCRFASILNDGAMFFFPSKSQVLLLPLLWLLGDRYLLNDDDEHRKNALMSKMSPKRETFYCGRTVVYDREELLLLQFFSSKEAERAQLFPCANVALW